MPVIVDPESVLPDKTKGVRPSQLILWLLFPVIFAVGFTVGMVVGIKQGQNSVTNGNNRNQNGTSTVIPNTNARIVANTANANTNVSNAFANFSSVTNSAGDFLKISAATQTELDALRQQDIDRLVDQTSSVTDQVRQRDLISTKYDLKAFYSVEGRYPSTNGAQIRSEGKAGESLYAEIKEFYGGSYNLKIDPESPKYYYGYTSDGASFTLTAYLTSKSTVFTLTDK